jgi:MFS family permease
VQFILLNPFKFLSKKAKNAKANLPLLAWFNFFVDFRLFSAILVLYFQKVTGSFVLAMSLYSIVSIASALGEVPTGIFSDLIGRKKTVVIGSLFVLIAFICYAIANSYWLLAIGAIMEGIGLSWYSGNNEALLHDSLKENNNEKSFDEYLGKIGSAAQLAAIIATLAGGFIANVSYKLLMYLSILPQIGTVLLALMLVEPKKYNDSTTNIFIHTKAAAKLLWKNKRLRYITLADIIDEAISEPSYQFRSAFFVSVWPLWAVGIAKTLSSLGGTISFWFSGKILKRIKAEKILVADILYSKIANIISLLMANVISPILMSTTSLWYGVSTVATKKIMHEEYSDKQRSTIASLKSLLGSILAAIYAILLGFFADKWSPITALFISQIITMPSLLIKWKLLRLNT